LMVRVAVFLLFREKPEGEQVITEDASAVGEGSSI
jgi:hypothetical protein